MSDNNEEKLRGGAQNLKGKLKEGLGKLANDPALENEGRAEQVVGDARVEDAKARERAKGVAENIKGKLKGAAGTLLDDEQLEAEGKAEELKGKGRKKANQ